MALTLAEADKYSTNQVLVGVAEITMDQNPLLGLLPFTPIRGNALQYQRELAASAPTFIAAGGTVIEGVPTTSLITTALKILIGDADIDNFLRVTRSKDQDLRAELLAMKARNFADTWGDAAIYGSIDAAAAQFDGLHEIISDDVTAQQLHAGATTVPGVGTFTLLRELVDLIRPRPTVLLPSPPAEAGVFGISADDPTAQDDLERITQVEDVGALETQDARRTRLKAYTALCVKASQAIGRIDGSSSGDWTVKVT